MTTARSNRGRKPSRNGLLSRAGVAAAAVAFVLTPAAAAATEFSDDPAVKGRQIAEETDSRDLGWGDARADMKMVLRNEHGDESVRELRQMSLENQAEDAGDYSLIVFDEPRDVEGTALLTHAKILDPDDQWMFLPAIKRVKRISSSNKSGPFMGSEFAFEDFASTEVGKYDYEWQRDEACPEGTGVEDRTCHVVERVPLYDNSGYTRQVVWTDTQDYQPRKIDYYNRGDERLKTLVLTDYRQYMDKHWRAHTLTMRNHLTGKSTVLTWEDFEFQTGLDQGDFDQASLRRIR